MSEGARARRGILKTLQVGALAPAPGKAAAAGLEEPGSSGRASRLSYADGTARLVRVPNVWTRFLRFALFSVSCRRLRRAPVSVCCLFGGRWGDSLLLLTPTTPRDCFAFGDTFEGCCQIIMGKWGGGMFFLPSQMQTHESHRTAAEGSRQRNHASAGTGALSAAASLCAALAEDDALLADPTTSI